MYVYIFRYLCIYINIYDMCFKSFLHIIFINIVFHQLLIDTLAWSVKGVGKPNDWINMW